MSVGLWSSSALVLDDSFLQSRGAKGLTGISTSQKAFSNLEVVLQSLHTAEACLKKESLKNIEILERNMHTYVLYIYKMHYHLFLPRQFHS